MDPYLKQTLITNFNQVNKLRFKTNKILIDENVWFSKKLILTNDPF